MKLYVGVRTELDRRVLVTSTQREFTDYRLSIERRADAADSPWGSGGAARLAQAILVDHLAVAVCDTRLSRRFAERLVATLPANFWVLSEREVAAAVARLNAEAI
jgi:hypothetical protein